MFLIPTLILVSVFFGFLVPIIKYKEETGPLKQNLTRSQQEEVVIRPVLKIESALISKKNVNNSDLDIDGAKMAMIGSVSTSAVIAGSITPFNNGINVTILTEEFHRATLNTGEQLWGWYVIKSTKGDNNSQEISKRVL